MKTPKTRFYARCDECKKYVPLSTLIRTSPGTYICADHQKPPPLKN